MVALTFDDGPDAEWTPQVLDALARTGVTATFFVVAEQIAEPTGADLVAAILEGGHSVQPHCARHVRHTELDLAALRSDIGAVVALLAETGVREPRLWRPPYGVLHPENTPLVAREAGLQLALWTHDPADYAGTPHTDMLRTLESINEDSVILLHDSRRYAHASDSAANTVALIDPLIALLNERNYATAPLSADAGL